MSAKTESKRTAVVTGATSGIGYHVAKELASVYGFKVYALGRRVEKMDPLKEEFGVIPVKCDVTNTESINQLRDRISAENDGTLDLLVQNAGGCYAAAAIDLDMDQLQRNFEVNLFAPMRITKGFAPLLIRAKGTIAFSGSIFGYTPNPLLSSYCSSKAALRQYANCLDIELRPLGVKVVHGTIGGVNTEFSSVVTTVEQGKDDYFNFQDEGFNTITHIEEKAYTDKAKVEKPEVFAKNYVSDILAKDPKYAVFRGSGSNLLWWIDLLFPRQWLRNLLWKKYDWLAVIERLKKSGKLDKKD